MTRIYVANANIYHMLINLLTFKCQKIDQNAK